jgi:predicted ester cyclase
MDASERQIRVRTLVEEVWNKRHYEGAKDLYAETYANGFGTGPAARVEPIRRYHQAFPDLRMQMEDLIASDDTVVLRSTFRGTDTGGYLGGNRRDVRWTSGASQSCISTAPRSYGNGSGRTISACSSNSGWSTTHGRNRRSRDKSFGDRRHRGRPRRCAGR